MHPLNLFLLLATTADTAPPPVHLTIDTRAQAETADPLTACVASRLTPFVSPYGINQAWPVMTDGPGELLHTPGILLSDMGDIADGYQHVLHIDTGARAVYVVQQGGFAGTTKIYGPLPLPRCMPAMTAPAADPIPR